MHRMRRRQLDPAQMSDLDAMEREVPEGRIARLCWKRDELRMLDFE